MMKSFDAELMEKAKSAKSAEELLAIAKENGVEMTADEAKECYEQIASCELDDDLLDGVAGGTVEEQEPIRKGENTVHPDDYKSHC